MDMNRRKAIVYLIITSILWSIGGLFIKLIDWNPLAIAGARSGIAALVMICYLRKPILALNRNKLLGALCYASLLILFVTANKLTTSANAILLQFTAPVWAALFSWYFLKEKIRISDWATIIAVMLGMTFFFVGDLDGGSTAGNLIAILSGIAMAGMVIFLKLQDSSSSVEMTLLGNIITFIIALPFFFGTVPNLRGILSLLVLGIFQLGISYILYVTAVKYVSSLEAVLIPIIEPLLNPVWVLLVAGESPGGFSLVGGVIVIGSIILRGLYQKKHGHSHKTTLETL